MHISEFLAKLEGFRRTPGTDERWTARCPAHEDKRRSLSVRHESGTILVKCHAGCTADEITAALGLSLKDLFQEPQAPKGRRRVRAATPEVSSPPKKVAPKKKDRPQRVVVKRYPYRSPTGAVLYEKLRWDPKDFSLGRKVQGPRGWRWAPGIPSASLRVLYHLPELLGSKGSVWICEGEKDADRLASLGLTATTTENGAKSWREVFRLALLGRPVVVLQDNDPPDPRTRRVPGADYAQQVAQCLWGWVPELRVVLLPHLPPKGDVSDYLSDGRMLEDLLKDVAAVAPWGSHRLLPPHVEEEGEPEDEALSDEDRKALRKLNPQPGAGLGPAGEACEVEQEEDEDDDLDLECLAPLKRLCCRSKLSVIAQVVKELAPKVKELGPVDREIAREAMTRKLKRIKYSRPGMLLAQVFPELPKGEGDQEEVAKKLFLAPVEPCDDAVEDGEQLLDEILRTVRRYVVVPEMAAEAITLWVAFAYAHDAFHTSPILVQSSPQMRCGKTTVQSVLQALVNKPLTVVNISPAALYRIIEAKKPTMLVDEGDAFLVGQDSERKEDLRGIINSGHTRSSACVVRCVGEDLVPMTFGTWCPKAIALIGDLPPTTSDRSIIIKMRRKLPHEVVERIRGDRIVQELQGLRQSIARWTMDHMEDFRRQDDPELPVDEVPNSRAQDNWRPLVTIADVAGGHWPALAREAMVELADKEVAEDNASTLMLQDIRSIFERLKADRLFTDELKDELKEMSHRPWPEWGRAKKPISPRGIAQLLKPYGIEPTDIRIADRTLKGYYRGMFVDAWQRYLPQPTVAPENRQLSLLEPAPVGREVAL